MRFDPNWTFLPSRKAIPPWIISLGLAIALGAIYFLAARLSLALISRPDGVAVFWPAAGVSSGVLIGLGLVAGLPVIAGTMMATVAANLLGDRNIWSALVFALCNAGEPVIVALLIQRFSGSPFRLDSVARVFGLVAAAMVAAAISGAVATCGYLLFHPSSASALSVWRNWFASDALGIVTIAPLMIGLFSVVREPPPPRTILEGLLALVCVMALAALVLELPSQVWAVEVIVALFFPLSLWIAARCHPVFAAGAIFIVAITVVWSTTFGMGVFGNPVLPAPERVLTAQMSILATTLSALILAALFAERGRHEAIAVKSEARLQSALRVGEVMAFDWMVREGVTRRSENAVQMLALEPNHPFSTASFFERVHPDDVGRLNAYLRDVSPGNPSYVVAFRYLRPDAREIWLEATARTEFDGAGRVTEVRGLTRDVTAFKRSEAELAASRKVAELADRAKSGFLAAASHDLRQPLQSLTLLGNALKPHIQDGNGQILIGRMERSLHSMKDILDSLLDINRLETGVLNPSKSNFSLQDLFASVQMDFLNLVKERGIEWRLVRSGLAVRSDRRMLELMLRNLLSNAVRHTDRGRILLGCRRAGNKVRIQVWDSGVGISEEHIPRIFDEYYQVEDHTHLGSFGLGLAIVQRLGNLLGHRVDVRSTPGKGSCFTIEAELALEAESKADGKAVLDQVASPAFDGTVLLVEDDAFVRRGIEALLTSEGLNVVSATNGHEAVDLVIKKGMRPDVVLSDFNLPGRMNGVETIQALRKALAREIPAVVLTGDIRSEVLDAIAKHNVAVATKPTDPDQLLRLVKQQYASPIILAAVNKPAIGQALHQAPRL
jgi:signal transduction histidine kinase/CheY-like chemotaxis protein/integral membrane sensor domain MASE1